MSDGELRSYLLGHLPATAAARLEERALEDQGLFIALKSVEDDLFDEYVRGQLSAADRAYFVERYGAEAGRLAFARALARRESPVQVAPFDRDHSRGRWVQFASQRAVGLAAAAVLILALGDLLIQRNTQPLETPRAEPRVANTRAVAIALTLGTSRSAGGSSSVTVPTDARGVQLRVRLDPADRLDRYSMELRSSSNTVAWHGDDLRASTEEGELVLAAYVPASAIADGAYELAVRGGHTDSFEELGFVTLEVHRTR